MPRKPSCQHPELVIARLGRTLRLAWTTKNHKDRLHVYVMHGSRRESNVLLPEAVGERVADLCTLTDVVEDDFTQDFLTLMLAGSLQCLSHASP